MRFEDEHYVKLYTRDTPTWKAMCWQAKAVLSLLLRKLDVVGAMECAELGRVQTVSVMIDVPAEVVEPGLADLARLKVVAWRRGDVLLAPKFIEAQEARKTDKLRKQEEREKARALLAAQEAGIIQGVSEPVQPRPLASESVTHGHSPTSSPTPSPTPSPEKKISSADADQPLLSLVDPTSDRSRQVHEVFDYWRLVLNHPQATLDDKRKRVIEKALRSWSVDQCKRAIDGCKASPFHMGENADGKVHDGLALILRDAEHFENFVAIARGGIRRVNGQMRAAAPGEEGF